MAFSMVIQQVKNLEVNTPFGSFYYRDGKGTMVCIAGGSGMSAVKAILETSCYRPG